MANAHTTSAGSSHGSYKSYFIGFIISVILTAIPFAAVMTHALPKDMTLLVVLVTAVVQVVVHLVYFLHLDRSSEQRWNVIAFVFSALIIAFLVGLSLWIMFSIHHFMMAK